MLRTLLRLLVLAVLFVPAACTFEDTVLREKTREAINVDRAYILKLAIAVCHLENVAAGAPHNWALDTTKRICPPGGTDPTGNPPPLPPAWPED
jgi:hypothetical protein